jgi:hypothetical protein
MHPETDLIRLAAHKVSLRRNIARQRAHCAAALARATQPLLGLKWLPYLSGSY